MATKSTTKAASKSASGSGSVSKRSAVVRKEIQDALGAIDNNSTELARLLYEAYHKEMYVEWGHEDFRNYCADELDVNYRKAMYFVDIWDKVKSLSLPLAKVRKLGWTKMKDIATVITDKNKDKLLADAMKKTSREVTEAVKLMRRKDTKGADLPTITTMSLRMSESEANIITDAIEEAKKLTESDNAVVALEMICQDWMTDQGQTPQKSSIEDHIEHLQRVYGVTLTVKKATKAQQAAAAKKAKAAAAKKKTTAKRKSKKAEAEAEVEAAEAANGDEGEQDIDDLLGI